jgi:hypothetical protein
MPAPHRGATAPPELRLRGVNLAVGHDELVDGRHELLLSASIEALEKSRSSAPELRVPRGRILVLRRLCEELTDALVDALEIDEVRGELADDFRLHRDVGVLHRLIRAAGEVANAFVRTLFFRVEVAVDVPNVVR